MSKFWSGVILTALFFAAVLTASTVTDTKIPVNVNVELDNNTEIIEDLETIAEDIRDQNLAQQDTQLSIRDQTEHLPEQFVLIQRLFGDGGHSVDAFDTAVVKNTESLINIPAHHPYNTERHRLYVDGTRQLLEYNDIPEYVHLADVHALRPEPSERITFESAEAPPYTVQYSQWGSWAGAVNRSLQEDDVIRIGLFNDENGYFLEHNSTHEPREVDLVVRRNGTETRRRPATLQKPLTEFHRYELRSNWYNAGQQKWIQTTTDLSLDDVQQNDVIGYTAPEGNRTKGPELPTLPLRFEVIRGSSTDPIQLNAGSMALVTGGDARLTSRVKTGRFIAEINQTGLWQPMAALRIEPENSYVRAEIDSVDLAEVSESVDAQIMAIQHANTKALQPNGSVLTEDLWSRPAEFSGRNSVIEFTDTVERAANETGDLVINTDDPGGFQVGWGSIYTTGNKGASASSAQQGRKRPIYSDDVVVFYGRADDEGNPTLPIELTVEYVVEQDY